ncbi:hypothetical protein AVEN_98440-1 [Araneus ventricosus]|uniref:Uncharacterized protein n=1 Tax=Araneus ventricosus TaxID=182803 RepID=A0A4Y2TA26_ARAVE|nr:hypothetical protein AVEN_98440-1 [Araneus ventricosus]
MKKTTLELAPPPQTFGPHQREDVLSTTSDLTCTRPAYASVLWSNPVLNLEPSDPESRPCHRATANPHGTYDDGSPKKFTKVIKNYLLTLNRKYEKELRGILADHFST